MEEKEEKKKKDEKREEQPDRDKWRRECRGVCPQRSMKATVDFVH